jgi:hypothetical protein
MASYCRYVKQVQEVSYDNGVTWKKVSPEVTQLGALIGCNDPLCGFVEPISRWVNLDINTDWICTNQNKYYKQKKQWSYDNGEHWEDADPMEYQQGELYEPQSYDCDYGVTWVKSEEGYICEIVPMVRWIVVENDYICGDGVNKYTKYTKEIEQKSIDGGQTWENTGNERGGDVIEYNSADCGYSPSFKYTIRILPDDVDTTAYPYNLYTIGIPIATDGYDVDFGDGQKATNVVSSSDGLYRHVYSNPGTYTVTITNLKPNIDVREENGNISIYASAIISAFAARNDKKDTLNLFKRCLVSIDDWGTMTTSYTYNGVKYYTNMYYDSIFGFYDCERLEKLPENHIEIFNNGYWLNDHTHPMYIHWLFAKCPKLQLPNDLFKNIMSMFDPSSQWTNYGLLEGNGFETIPEDLFVDCTEQLSFNNMFKDCKNLTSIPKGLFQNCYKMLNLNYCFSGCTSLTGETPTVNIDGVEYKLWEVAGKGNYQLNIYGKGCFHDCTNLADYDSIPDNWK